LKPGGSLVLTVPNGYGYKEIERRLLYLAYETAQRLPLGVRKRLRWAYQAARKHAKAMLRPRASVGSRHGAARAVMGTLNFQNDVHVQAFTLHKITRRLRSAGFVAEKIDKLQVFGGIAGSLVEKLLPESSLLKIIPIRMSADWMIVCRSLDSQENCQASYQSHRQAPAAQSRVRL